jgi:integrase
MVGRVVPLATSEQALAAATEAFLAQPSLARSTRRSYDQTLTRLVRELGSDRPLSTLTVEAITVAVTTAWGGRAPATWNRQVATVRSFLAFCRRRRWLAEDLTVDLERRPEPADRTKAIPPPQLEQLWRREDVGLREKALWRLLYETAARANELLALDVEDLDLANRRARVHSKGGAVEWVFWQTGSAQLLPRLLAGRTRGPVFLGDRRPTRAVAGLDLDPTSGRARLSYRRAAELFHVRTGWTLHQLRHSALTHAAEDGTNLPLLLARSRHASVRSLERYARPGPEAVARHLADTDPARRRP